MTAFEKSVPIVLKYDNWPEADQRAWCALVTPAGLFDDGGKGAHWSDGTQKMHKQAYGQWLSYLHRNHKDLVPQAPDQRVTRETVQRFVLDAQSRLQPRSVANLVTGLTLVVTNTYPGDWGWLNTLCRRLQNEANAYRLKPILNLSAGEIFKWSLQRMAEVEDADLRPLKRAIYFRQALMIGFLICRPVRRRALLAMTVTTHVERSAESVIVHFRKEDMKDGLSRSFGLPEELVQPFLLYLDIYRPVLVGDGRLKALWVNQYGEAITPDGLSRELPKVTATHLGVELRPHAFRHIAATSIAEFDPEHVGIIRDLLGHATMKTAEKYYNRAGSISSCNALQKVVAGYRK
ncbi:tyrosine-type recombinase/integrase [Primorskyibacter sp. S87]|uniref:tyrosine-type recombinase/integrase n=1 Tax=Primorskyibacter sp. S87 TaxID=3415126 RepID=UPI003C7E554B